MSKELLNWAKGHIKDLKVDKDRLYYRENDKLFLVTFSNKIKIETYEELGTKVVKVQMPREGMGTLFFTLSKALEV
ncbi:MAG: hypothetical protein QXV17_15035 [Candidatus Micrarchaeaceae archaeon]